MSIKKLYIVILFLCGAQTLVWSQQAPYINYTTHNGLPQIQVQYLHQDQKGYIWVGTKGGLARYNGEKFETFLQNQYIFSINETMSGDILIGTRTGLYQCIRGKMEMLQVFSEESSVLAGKDTYWVSNAKNIREFKNNKHVATYAIQNQYTHFAYSNYYDAILDVAFFLSKDIPNTVFVVKNQQVEKLSYDFPFSLQKFENGKVYILAKNIDTFQAMDPYTKEIYFQFQYINQKIEKVQVFSLPTEHHLLNLQADHILLHQKTKGYSQIGLPTEKLTYAMIQDKDGNFWTGTDNGLYQIANGPLQMFPLTYMNDVWTIIKGKDGYFYTGIYKNGLYKMNFDTGYKSEIKVKNNDGTYEKDYYYGASKDNHGNLYFPTQNGLVLYNYTSAKKLDTQISIFSSFDTISHRIIYGQENGFALIDSQGHKTTFIDKTKQLIVSRPITFATKDKENIWMGSWENFLVFNRKDKQFQSVKTRYPIAPHEGVISMANDQQNNLWIGATDGLWFYNKKQDSFTKIGQDIFKTYILDVKVIASDFLIVGTSFELFVINLKSFMDNGKLIFKMFNYRNGFISEEIAQNGMLVDETKVYIPSTTYTSVLDLEKITFEPDYFNVFVTTINQKGVCREEVSGKTAITLDKNTNKIEVSYETVGFGLPTQSLFQYKLEGYDTSWSEWQKNNQTIYTNLSSGKYTFKVRAMNGSQDGNTLLKESKVQILVSLPFYKEPSFYKLAFFVLLLFTAITTYLVYIWYKKSVKVAENERKLKFQEIATLQAQLNPHFIFNFLSSVQSIINQNLPEKANDFLVKFSRLMRSYMESSIKNSKIFSGNITGNEISIKDEVEMLKTYIDLEQMKYPEGTISYEITLENDNLLNKTIPPLIIQPFVENAIKHGILPSHEKGLIQVSFTEKDDYIYCTITDNGIGRKESMLRKQQSIPANKSRGLELIKNRVEVLNQLGYHIDISFIDPDMGGTIISIKIQV